MKAPLIVSIALAAGLSGCVNQQVKPSNPYDKPTVAKVTAPIRMPSGFNPDILELVEDGRLIRIYTQMDHIGDPSNAQLLFPVKVAQQLGLTNSQINRRFGDALRATRRFTIFDAEYTVVQNQSQQRYRKEDADIVVSGQVVEARQHVVDISPYRKVLTNVKLSVRMINRLTGESLFDGAVAVDGSWGNSTGEGTMLSPSTNLQNPDFQSQVGADYEKALTRALDAAVERIVEVARPMARITHVEGDSVSIFGGSRSGFMADDEIVVVRPFTRRMPDGKEKVFRTQAVAVARCEGVGTDVSQCELIRQVPGLTPKDGDFAVLSDSSTHRVRR